MGRKPESIKALEFLIEKGFEIACVVAIPTHVPVIWKKRLCQYAESRKLPITDDKGIYRWISSGKIGDIDIVVSYLYPYKVKKPLLNIPKIGAINFHPAPLPELRGLGGYNIAILEDFTYYGVSAHYMSEEIDAGDIIKVLRFPINPEKETAFSLEKKTRPYLLKLFYEVMLDIKKHGKPEGVPQKGGRYISRREFEKMKVVNYDDPPELIEKKIRAFFYPPYEGAVIELNDRRYTLLSEEILRDIGEKYHND